jgi:hypothetical protein
MGWKNICGKEVNYKVEKFILAIVKSPNLSCLYYLSLNYTLAMCQCHELATS